MLALEVVADQNAVYQRDPIRARVTFESPL